MLQFSGFSFTVIIILIVIKAIYNNVYLYMLHSIGISDRRRKCLVLVHFRANHSLCIFLVGTKASLSNLFICIEITVNKILLKIKFINRCIVTSKQICNVKFGNYVPHVPSARQKSASQSASSVHVPVKKRNCFNKRLFLQDKGNIGVYEIP